MEAMNKIRFAYFFLSLTFIVGCNSAVAPPTFSTNSLENRDISQFVWTFEEDLGLIGGHPTSDQINHLNIRGENFPGCNWRYIGTKSIACELQDHLPLNSEFTVTVQAGFPTLNSTLGSSVSNNIRTSSDITAEDLQLYLSGESDDVLNLTLFHEVLSINYFEAEILAHLKFRDANGVLHDFDPSLTSSDEIPGFNQARFDVPFPKNLEGLIEVIIPQGTKLSHFNLPTNQDIILFSKYFGGSFAYIGYSCEFAWIETATDIQDSTDIECPSDHATLWFTHSLSNHPFSSTHGTNFLEAVVPEASWITGGAFTRASIGSTTGGMGYINMLLEDNETFNIDLEQLYERSNLEQLNVNPPKNQTLTINKLSIEPHWLISHHGSRSYSPENIYVIDTLEHLTNPNIISRNQEIAEFEIYPVNSASDLVMFQQGLWREALEGDKELFRLEFNDAQRSGEPVPLDVASFISPNSSAVIISPSEGQFTHMKPSLYIQQEFAIVTGFIRQDLVYVTDWANNPLEDITVELNCGTIDNSFILGVSDEHGRVANFKDALLDTNSTFEQCFIVASNQELTSTQFLPHIDFRGADDIEAEIQFSQELFRPGDTISANIIIKHRNSRSLDENLTARLIDQNGNTVDVFESSISQFGMADATFDPNPTFPAGRYRVEVSYGGSVISRDSTYISDFKLTESDLSIVATHVTENNQHFIDIQATATSLTGFPLSDTSVELEINFRKANLFPTRTAEGHNVTALTPVETDKEETSETIQTTMLTNSAGRAQTRLSIPFDQTRVTIRAMAQPATGDVLTSRDSLTINLRESIPVYQYIGNNVFDFFYINQQGENITQTPPNVTSNTASCAPQAEHTECIVANDVQSTLTFELRDDTHELWGSSISLEFVQANLESQKARNVLQLETTNVWYLTEENSISVYSEVDTTANITVSTDKVHYFERVNLQAGYNMFSLPVEEEWGPIFHLSVFYVNKNEVEVLTTPEHMVSATASRTYQEESQYISLRQERENQFTIKAELSNSEVQSVGSPSSLTLTSSLDSDVRVLVIDEAAVLNARMFERLADHEFVNDEVWRIYRPRIFSDSRELLPTRFQSRILSGLTPQVAFSLDSPQEPAYRQRTPSPYEWASIEEKLSYYSDVIPLKANQPFELDLKLPERATRWYIFTLAITERESTHNLQQVTTVAELEHSISAPLYTYKTDTPSIEIISHNRSESNVTETFDVLLNGSILRSVQSQLIANSTTITNSILQGLQEGTNNIEVIGRSSGLSRSHRIEVLSDTRQFNESYLYTDSDNPINWEIPTEASGIQFNTTDFHTAPNWLTLKDNVHQYPFQCWEQNISRVAALFSLPEENRGIEETLLIQDLLASSSAYSFAGKYSYYKNAQPDFFLTALSWWYATWLNENEQTQSWAENEISNITHPIYQSNHRNIQISESAQALALWAEVRADKIELEGTLERAMEIGRGTLKSRIFLVGALREAGADSLLINRHISEIESEIYIDEELTVLSNPEVGCFASLAFGATHPLSIQINQQILEIQNTSGEFGTTLANGVCSLLFQGQATEPANTNSVDFTQDGSIFTLQLQEPSPQSVVANYELPISTLQPVSNGMSLSRERYVLRGTDWLLVNNSTQLYTGDLVKTRITLFLNNDLEHVAIKDFLPGSFLNINNHLEQLLGFYDQFGDTNKNELHFYFYKLSQGEHVVTHHSQVLSAGRYFAPAPISEAMYHTSNNARGDSEWVTVLSRSLH
ncbi:MULTISPECIES: MG2 domain-containing protein [Gammaproteobacteria]|uniref:alpha-2-macroglobulin family protein n=1 Tax=Gammaproteobacteria TaxID=1236 RepID=UPI000DD0587E|nr:MULTISPECIES: MG2 domain-containing protein [Gammaproteobacteria]RTE85838.1 hypothetical protein DQX04_10340 [Aliidiomarina sp. B3213]TCZ90161.1 hypothetical protein EYQ95_10115 [Lysobacter sp. N42]